MTDLAPPPPRSLPWLLLRLTLAAVLLAAATLKAYEAAWQPLQVGMVLAEALLALALLTNIYPTATRYTAAAVFALFFTVSLFKGTHQLSCGCFGPAPIPTPLVAAFDAAALAALLAIGLKSRPLQWLPTLSVVALAFSLLAVGGYNAHAAKTAPVLTDPLAISATQRAVILEPDTWIGKPLPLLAHISPHEPLQKGEWLLFIYSNSCRHCQMAVPFFLEVAQKLAQTRPERRVAFVQMAPYADPEEPRDPQSKILDAQLSDAHDWYVRTPVVLLVNNGTVTAYVASAEELPVDWGGYPPEP